jgi:hypothetical protein
MPSLIEVVATGASCNLLIPAPPPAMSEAIALCPGFSVIPVDSSALASSSFFRRSSANAAAPVSGVKDGENTPVNRGDFGFGDCPKPTCAIEARFGFCDWSALLRFKDFVRAGSESGGMVAVDESVAASDKFVGKVGEVAAETAACSEAMNSSECVFLIQVFFYRMM